jgi:hypothetical protein
VDAIWDFQVFWKAKGVFRNIDAVVDPNKNTLKKLNELAPSGPDPEPGPKTKVDVIVKFEGAAEEAPIARGDDIFPDKRLTAYGAKRDRTLVRLGMKTVKIRDEAVTQLQAQVEAIKSLFSHDEPGEILLYGSSSGGRNIVDLAARLSREAMSIAYVASLDGAWYPDETKTSPGNLPGDSSVIPRFNAPGAVVAAEKQDFFQTVGNHTKLNKHGTRIFTSNMLGEEIHGNVVGFVGQDLSAQVRGFEPEDDDRAHSWLTIVATPKVHARMQAILDAL